MTVVDIHTHLYEEPDMDVESSLRTRDVESISRRYAERVKAGPVDHAVAIVMDDDFLRAQEAVETLERVRSKEGCFSLVFLVDPLDPDATELVERASEIDALGVKLHPYIQNLTEDRYDRIRTLLSAVESEDLLTIVDCSYGGRSLYECNGVHLGHTMAKSVDSPILLAHGGGARVLDAMSSALAFDNVYLDTSFSLTYWRGSSVERDFAFAMEKLDMERWLWGSDDPYVSRTESLANLDSFLEDHGLTDFRDRLVSETARELIPHV